MIGEAIGNHQVTARLGEGVTGTVYKARHTVIGRHVAIKILRPEYSSDPDLVARFFDVLRTVSGVEHPSIVAIFDFGYYRENAYVVMEYLEYETLEARVRRDGRMRNSFAVEIVRQVTDALDVVHRAGVLHEDLKADNIVLIPDPAVPGGERAKLLDFGLATLLGDPGTAARKVRDEAELPLHTAPEQLAGPDAVDQRADLYSVGSVWYEMICGRPPFVSRDIIELVPQVLQDLPPSPRSLVPTVPAEVEEVVLRLLAKSPAERYPSAEALAEALDELQGDFMDDISSISTIRPPVQVRFSTYPPDAERRASTQWTNANAESRARGRNTRLWLAISAVCLLAFLIALAFV